MTVGGTTLRLHARSRLKSSRKLDKETQISDLAIVREIIVSINNNNPGFCQVLQAASLEVGG